jgi:hypothetical protein
MSLEICCCKIHSGRLGINVKKKKKIQYEINYIQSYKFCDQPCPSAAILELWHVAFDQHVHCFPLRHLCPASSNSWVS